MEPELIHPVPVTLELLNRAAMAFDADAREGLHGARSTAADVVTVEAQIRWEVKDDPMPEQVGMRQRSRGYILVRNEDLREQAVVLKRGDRIVQIGEDENALSVDLYLTGQEPIAHYPDQLGATLLKWHFEDRHPVRQVGDL
jgi:hypothetical protein